MLQLEATMSSAMAASSPVKCALSSANRRSSSTIFFHRYATAPRSVWHHFIRFTLQRGASASFCMTGCLRLCCCVLVWGCDVCIQRTTQYTAAHRCTSAADAQTVASSVPASRDQREGWEDMIHSCIGIILHSILLRSDQPALSILSHLQSTTRWC